MAGNIDLGVDGRARRVKKAYIGIDGRAHEVKKLYLGVDGRARPVYRAEAQARAIALSWTIGEPYYGNNTVQPGRATFTAAITPGGGEDVAFTWSLDSSVVTGAVAGDDAYQVKPSSYRTGTAHLTVTGGDGLTAQAEITVAKQSVSATSPAGAAVTKSIPVITSIVRTS